MTDTVETDVKFAMVPEWLIRADVSSRAVHLYAALHRRADKDTNVAFPSRRFLADWLHCSPDSVDRALADLVRVGAVTVEARSDGQRQTSNRYILRGCRAAPVQGEVRAGADDDERARAQHPLGARAQGKNESHKERESNERETRSNTCPTSASAAVAVAPQATDVADEFDPTVVELTRRLGKAVMHNGHKTPKAGSKTVRAWFLAIDRLLRLDGADPGEVERVIDWCTADDFWQANIRSAPKFREKYSTLRLHMQRRNGNGRHHRANQLADQYAAAAEEARRLGR